TVLVNAHHAATAKDGLRDGFHGRGGWRPFQGGHYRLPWRQSGLSLLQPASPEGERNGSPGAGLRKQRIVERAPVGPEGEIHLGPGWKLAPYGALAECAGGPYRTNASHNAGILYHEYGHHLTRHTADFCGNALRPRDRQSNLKSALDEGTSDYLAAT